MSRLFSFSVAVFISVTGCSYAPIKSESKRKVASSSPFEECIATYSPDGEKAPIAGNMTVVYESGATKILEAKLGEVKIQILHGSGKLTEIPPEFMGAKTLQEGGINNVYFAKSDTLTGDAYCTPQEACAKRILDAHVSDEQSLMNQMVDRNGYISGYYPDPQRNNAMLSGKGALIVSCRPQF